MDRLGSLGRPFVFAFDFEKTEALLVPDPFESEELFFSVRGRGNGMPGGGPGASRTGAPAGGPDAETLVPEPMSYGEYARGFGVVRRGLLRGDSYLVNLTARTPVGCGLDLAGVYRRAGAMYRLLVPGRFVCFSPEIFVRIEDGLISTFPMKGTIDASVPDAERKILADLKETAEHATVVDLLRNDLSMFASGVHVRRWRYVDRIRAREREILQVSSEVSGRLPAGWRGRLGEIMLGLTPAGSCSGAPKESTLRIIREAEGIPRGYYTGVFGLFDGRTLDTGVLIRFVEEEGGRLFFRSGGGITAMSRPRDEYREVLEKICLPLPEAGGAAGATGDAPDSRGFLETGGGRDGSGTRTPAGEGDLAAASGRG
ncbi:MAG: aminodeoxychorismate synthase component I [Deltaproteobacteria bacterium]|jgi:para-aminobenzoate synthetase component 1|nr:aminodeoxychorismate synthase component I [Deltaproteobacteria bacterium]